MNRHLRTLCCALAIAALAACASGGGKDLPLAKLDSDLAALTADEQIVRYALADLREAQGLARRLKNDTKLTAADREHLLYLTERRMAIATARASQGAAEAELNGLERDHDRILLQATLAQAESSAQEVERLRRLNVARSEETERALAASRQASAAAAERAREAQLAREQAELAQQQAAEQTREAEFARQEADLAAAEADALRRQLENLQARKTDRGLVLTLGDVLFESGQAELRQASLANLDKLVNFVEQHPQRKVSIEGHTDSSGSEQFNLNLSQRRADAVRKALLDRGVAAERLDAVGLGEEFPVASNDTAFGKQKNRRVEVVILNGTGAG